MAADVLVKHYQDLAVWQKAMDLTVMVYKITEQLPKSEVYGLASQIRRAAVSVPSNIAEGSSRRSTGEFIRFTNIASGSVAELQTQTMLMHRLGYCNEEIYSTLINTINEVGRMLYGLQNSLSKVLNSK